MPTAKTERATILECTERHGVIIRLVKQARVINLTNTDHQALVTALATAGIPAVGTTITGAPNLILTERSVKMLDETTADVNLTYEHILNEGQKLDTPVLGMIAGEVTSTVSQVPTNLDENGNAITVKHTWPATDHDFPGRTDEQGGEIQFFQPQKTMRFEGIKNTATPWLIANTLIGSVNKNSWAGGGIHEWMCTNVSWKVHKAESGAQYFMVFEFQHNPDSWNPTAVFTDERTGKPPVGLIEDIGFKYIRKHREINFEAALGARVQGG